MNTSDHSHTNPAGDNAGTDDQAMRREALRLKAQAAGQEVHAYARGAMDQLQADLDDVAARIAHAGGDTRNELLARQAQLRAEVDQARMDLLALGASAVGQIADDAMQSGNK